MIRKLLLLLGLALAPGIAHATCPVIPFVFPATSINPLQVNANFTTIRDCITSATGLTQVSSSTALRALQAGLYPMVYRNYDQNPGDGTGVYAWSPGSACTDDGVSCIKPASNPATGRWTNGVLIAAGLGGATIGNVTDVIAVSRPGVSAAAGIGFSKTTPTATDGSSVLVTRNAAYTGGTPGSVNAGFQSACHAGAGITSYEWCGLYQMDNAGVVADGAQNVALYAQGVKRTTGATWAATFELRDMNTTDAGSSSPVAVEMDVSANDADPAANRTILHLVGNKLPGGSGVTPVIDAMIKLGTGNPADATYTTAIRFLSTTYGIGLDMRDGTYTSGPIWLPDDSPLILDTAGIAKLVWDSGTSSIAMLTTGNALRQQFFGTGQITTTDGTVGMTLDPLNGSTAGILATTTAHDLVLQRNAAEKLRLITTGVDVTGDIAVTGAVNGASFFVGATPGVTCAPGSPSASFATVNGIVTAC